jgi:chromosome segregation ATPase
MKLATLALCTALALTSCAHVAKHYDSPDHSKLDAASKRLDTAVAELKTASAKVTAGMADARRSHAHEIELTRAFDKPLADMAKVAPAELMPAVRELQQRLAELEASQQENEAKLNELSEAQKQVDAIAAEASAATAEVRKYTPEFQKKVDDIVEKLNLAEQAWAKDSKEIVSLRMSSLLGKILMVIAVLFIAGIAALFFFGKLSVAGVRAAIHI